MRPSFAFLLVVVLAFSAFAGPGSAPPPRSAAGRRIAIEDALAQLDALSKKARVPPALARVRAYRAMTPDQLADPKRGVDLEEILAIVKREDVPAEIRDEAANTITWDQALRSDPTLDMGGKGLRRARAAFTLKVLSLLTDANDLTGRGLAMRICQGLWPNAKDPAFSAFDARKRQSCAAARASWESILKR